MLIERTFIKDGWKSVTSTTLIAIIIWLVYATQVIFSRIPYDLFLFEEAIILYGKLLLINMQTFLPITLLLGLLLTIDKWHKHKLIEISLLFGIKMRVFFKCILLISLPFLIIMILVTLWGAPYLRNQAHIVDNNLHKKIALNPITDQFAKLGSINNAQESVYFLQTEKTSAIARSFIISRQNDEINIISAQSLNYAEESTKQINLNLIDGNYYSLPTAAGEDILQIKFENLNYPINLSNLSFYYQGFVRAMDIQRLWQNRELKLHRYYLFERVIRTLNLPLFALSAIPLLFFRYQRNSLNNILLLNFIIITFAIGLLVLSRSLLSEIYDGFSGTISLLVLLGISLIFCLGASLLLQRKI